MRYRTKSSLSAALLALVASVCIVAPALGQATKTTREAKSFEIISVDGNTLVVRGPDGTREHTVPEDFRFTVDGKSLSVHQLKAGMKGTAVITTTTTSRPVYVTEVKEGQVVKNLGAGTVILRSTDGVRMFSQGEADDRGIRVYRAGKPVLISDLREGDKLTATFVTQSAPQVMTEQQVEATLAKAAAAVTDAASAGAAATQDAASKAAGAVSDAATSAAATTADAASRAADATTEAAQSATQSATDAAQASDSSSWLMWLVIGAIAVIIAVVALRKSKSA